MEDQNEKLPPIIDQLKDYVETRIKLAKYEAIDGSAKFLASLITDMVVGVTFVLTFLFVSIAIAFLLSNALHSYWAGFGCMAGIYLVIAIIIILMKEKIQRPLINLFIKKFFK
jgi:hypothetical protein